MARLNVDEGSRTDPRITKLARVTGELRFTTVGRIQEVWWLCSHRKSAVVPKEDIDLAAELDGFADAMVACRLAEPAENSADSAENSAVRVKGVEDRIEYLIGQAERGRKSAKARAGGQPTLNHGSANAEPALSPGSGMVQPTSSSSSSSSSSSTQTVPAEAGGLFGGDPPPAAEPAPLVKQIAEAACAEINRLTGSSYSPTAKATVQLAATLARAKHRVADVVDVIRDKHAEWWPKPEMRERVCPATLLALKNFERYLDALRSRPSGVRAPPQLSVVTAPRPFKPNWEPLDLPEENAS